MSCANKKLTLVDFLARQEKADAKKTGSAKGWVARRRNRCNTALDIIMTPNPVWADLLWSDSK